MTSAPATPSIPRCYGTVLLDIRDDLSSDIDGHCEGVASIVPRLRVDHRVDPDEFACSIDQGPTTVTRVDGSIGLDEGTYTELVARGSGTRLSADDTCRDGAGEVEGVPYSQDPLAETEVL